jgi:sulfate transport system permease protein
MAGSVPTVSGGVKVADRSPHISESSWVKWLLIGIALLFLVLILILPLITVFSQAFRKGIDVYIAAITEPDARAAIKLTLIAAGVAVPLNLLFGLAAAWSITKFTFKGKNILTTLIDLPFAISPVIAGLIFILLFGARGMFGPWLMEHDIKIIFSTPGII